MAQHKQADVEIVKKLSGWFVGAKSMLAIVVMFTSGVFTVSGFYFQVQNMESNLRTNQVLLQQVTERQQGVLQQVAAMNTSLSVFGRQLDRLEQVHVKP